MPFRPSRFIPRHLTLGLGLGGCLLAGASLQAAEAPATTPVEPAASEASVVDQPDSVVAAKPAKRKSAAAKQAEPVAEPAAGAEAEAEAEAEGSVPNFTDWRAYRTAVRDAERAKRHATTIALIEANGFTLPESDRDRSRLHASLIGAFLAEGEFAKAEQTLRAFISSMPDEGDSHANAAGSFFNAAKRAGDVAVMRSALGVYESLASHSQPRLVTEMRLDIATAPVQLQSLVEELQAKNELSPADLQTLATIHEESDWQYYDRAAAADYWLRLYAMEPENSSALRAAIGNFLATKQVDKALATYQAEKAKLDNRDAQRVVRELAPALVNNDRAEESRTLISEVVADLPELEGARLQAHLSERANLDADAEEHYRRALQLAETADDTKARNQIIGDLIKHLRNVDRSQDAILILDGLIVDGAEEDVQQLQWRLERARLRERVGAS